MPPSKIEPGTLVTYSKAVVEKNFSCREYLFLVHDRRGAIVTVELLKTPEILNICCGNSWTEFVENLSPIPLSDRAAALLLAAIGIRSPNEPP